MAVLSSRSLKITLFLIRLIIAWLRKVELHLPITHRKLSETQAWISDRNYIGWSNHEVLIWWLYTGISQSHVSFLVHLVTEQIAQGK